MAITLYTVQIAQHRLCKALGIPLLDTTYKSGVEHLSPESWRVWQYKRGEISEAEYTEHYVQRMRQSLVANPTLWEELKKYESVALACYCKAGKFCHRHVLLVLVQKYLVANGIEVVLGGELTKDLAETIPRVLDNVEQGNRSITESPD